MWLVVAVVAIAAFLFIDPSQYLSNAPTDKEINQAIEDDQEDILGEDIVDEEITDFVD